MKFPKYILRILFTKLFEGACRMTRHRTKYPNSLKVRYFNYTDS